MVRVLLAAYLLAPAVAFHPAQPLLPTNDKLKAYGRLPPLSAIGIFFGTASGSTKEVADLIKEELGDDAEGPFNIDEHVGSLGELFSRYDALVVGTPTYNTDADTMRSATGWDSVYYGELTEIELAGKPVACFGLGDQFSYASNFADAMGELHDVFQGRGCRMHGYTSVEGFEHDASKSQRGDIFVGLACDMANDPDAVYERLPRWVEQIKREGLLDGAAASSSENAPPKAEPVVDAAPQVLVQESSKSISNELEELVAKESKKLAKLERAVESHVTDEAAAAARVDATAYVQHYVQFGTKDLDTADVYPGYVPFRSKTTKQTLWISTTNHRESFYTQDG